MLQIQEQKCTQCLWNHYYRKEKQDRSSSCHFKLNMKKKKHTSWPTTHPDCQTWFPRTEFKTSAISARSPLRSNLCVCFLADEDTRGTSPKHCMCQHSGNCTSTVVDPVVWCYSPYIDMVSDVNLVKMGTRNVMGSKCGHHDKLHLIEYCLSVSVWG